MGTWIVINPGRYKSLILLKRGNYGKETPQKSVDFAGVYVCDLVAGVGFEPTTFRL